MLASVRTSDQISACMADVVTAFFLIACAALNLLFIICATRINVVFFIIFIGAFLGFVFAASARWCIAEGYIVTAGHLVVVNMIPILIPPDSTDGAHRQPEHLGLPSPCWGGICWQFSCSL